MAIGVSTRRRDGKPRSWALEVLMGEEKGMAAGPRADLGGVPWGSDQREAGESASSEGS